MRPLALLALLLLAPALAGCLEGVDEAPVGDNGTAADDAAGEPEVPEGSTSNMCIEGAEDCEDAVGAEVEDVAFRTLAQGQQSGVSQSVRRVFDTEDAWESFWSQHASNEIPAPAAPEVDFARERVVAVVLSEKPNGCYAAGVTNVTRSGEAVVVEVTTYTPDPSRACTAVVTRPHHFVAIVAEETDVSFVERSRQGPPGA